MKWPILLLAASILVLKAPASPGGAPSSACDTMLPGHGANPKDSASNPFKLTVDKTSVDGGEEVLVKIEKTGSSSPQFKGFIIKAVDNDDNDKILGEFAIAR